MHAPPCSHRRGGHRCAPPPPRPTGRRPGHRPARQPPDLLFDRTTRLAALTLGAPVSAFTLVDAQRDFYKSAHGFIEPLASSRQLEGRTFCQHTMALMRPLVLEDAEAWPGYRDVPTVRSMDIRAYLGVPIVHAAGQCIGTLCVLDTVPRAWTERDLDLMTEPALSLTRELELRAAALEAQTATQAKSAFLATTPCCASRSPTPGSAWPRRSSTGCSSPSARPRPAPPGTTAAADWVSTWWGSWPP